MNILLICVLLLHTYICYAIRIHPLRDAAGGLISGINHVLVDEDGRERIFHGVNVVYKGYPWHPITDHFDPLLSFSDQDMDLLQSLGMNAVRLGVMWPGVEPQKGQYNNTYLQVMRSIVDKLGQRGIYSMIDFHQDSLSEKYCGEGIPVWASEAPATPPFPWPLQANPFPIDPNTGVPSPQDCNKFFWPDYEFAAATAVSYQTLYSSIGNFTIQPDFINYWLQLVNTFANTSYVLGYELMNEPFAGNIYSNPALMIPGMADKLNLAPFYENVSAAIRQIDNEHIIFFDSVTWDDIGTGFDTVPGGEQYINKSVLSYHYYDPPNLSMDFHFAIERLNMGKLGCAGFLTEFDIDPDVNDKSGIASMVATADLADFYGQSWTGWEYKPYVEITGWGYGPYYANGTLNTMVAAFFARSYPQAVAGHIISYSFNQTNATFNLQYTIKTSCQLPTVITYNQDYYYMNGLTIEFEPAGIATARIASSTLIEIDHLDNAQDGETLTLTMTPLNEFSKVNDELATNSKNRQSFLFHNNNQQSKE